MSIEEAEAVDDILDVEPESTAFLPGVATAGEFFGSLAMLWYVQESGRSRELKESALREWKEHCERTGEDNREFSHEFIQAFKSRWLLAREANADGRVEDVGRVGREPSGSLFADIAEAPEALRKRARRGRS
jgi:hypothetical protein